MASILANPNSLSKAIEKALGQYCQFRLSVAWASSQFPLFSKLLARKRNISQLVVGTHFYQTHPDFLKEFVDDPRARVVLQPSGVFHPKLYFFENSRED
jgi:hypothetical protein